MGPFPWTPQILKLRISHYEANTPEACLKDGAPVLTWPYEHPDQPSRDSLPDSFQEEHVAPRGTRSSTESLEARGDVCDARIRLQPRREVLSMGVGVGGEKRNGGEAMPLKVCVHYEGPLDLVKLVARRHIRIHGHVGGYDDTGRFSSKQIVERQNAALRPENIVEHVVLAATINYHERGAVQLILFTDRPST